MLYETTKTLCDIPGPVGNESAVIDHLTTEWGQFADIRLTKIGNLLARVGGSGSRVLIQAHADEIGMFVKSITDNGFILPVRGHGSGEMVPPSPAVVLQHVTVLTDNGPIPGVVGMSHAHAMTPEQRKEEKLSWKDLFVDVGARSQDEAFAMGIKPGTPIIFSSRMMRLGNHIAGKAIDARAGLAVISGLLGRLDPAELGCELFVAATVQEEMGCVGALSLLREQDFDWAIAIDCGLAGDIPTTDMQEIPCKLGGGPIIVHKDTAVHYDRRLIAALAAAAADAGITVQDVVFMNYGSDGSAFIRTGIPSALVAFATRYTHSPWEVADLNDIEQTVALLHQAVTTPNFPGK